MTVNILAALLLLGQLAPPTQQPAVQRPAGSISVEPVGMMIAAFDADGDARVTRTEFDAGVARSFGGSDPARGGMSMIDLSHWALRWLGNQGAVPGQYDFDRDGDNLITNAEYAAEFGRLFARFDANKDGVLDRSELVRIGAPPRERKEDRRRDEREEQRQRHSQ